jgi:tRNA threonylcarbamoyladenosine biosynthesis protein TsaE
MTPGHIVLETCAPEETERLGRALASLLPVGTVVALHGEIGAGKTCLVRGMAAHCAPDDLVQSPTFTLVNEYDGAPTLYHIDLYRLTSPDEIIDIGCDEYFDSDGICAVEWAERAAGLLPETRLDVFLEHAGDDRRKLRFADLGVMPDGWAEALRFK